MIREKLTGVGVAMITPFTSDGRVDYQALARMIDYVIEGGVDYIVALVGYGCFRISPFRRRSTCPNAR